MYKLAVCLTVGLLVLILKVEGQCPCADIQPDGEFTCEQQRKFDKCSEQFMLDGGFCDATCDKCPQECLYEPPEVDLSCGCTDNPPEGDYTCDQQRRFGSCWEDWMLAGNYCQASCGRCVCVDGVKCSDMPPPGNVLCLKQVEFGQCNKDWMKEGDFCNFSCGRCPTKNQIRKASKEVTQDEEKSSPKIIEILSPELPSIEIETFAPANVGENFDDVIEAPSPVPRVPPVVSTVPEPKEEDVEIPQVVVDTEQDIAQLSEDVAEMNDSEEVAVVPAEDSEAVTEKLLDALANATQTLENIATPTAEECDTTLFQTLSSTLALSQLAELVTAAGLENTLDNPEAQFTVFAPNNQAIQKFIDQYPEFESYFEDDSKTGQLQSIVGYHVVNSSYSFEQLTELPFVETLLGKDVPLFVEVQRNKINLEGLESSATIVTQDIQVCKSIVHIINNVLLSDTELVGAASTESIPQATASSPAAQSSDCVKKSIQQTLDGIPGATTFTTALEAVEFDSFPSGPLTIFLPDEAAFQEALSALGFQDLADAVQTDEGQQLFMSILMYHMVAGYFPSEKLSVGAPVTSLNGSILSPEVVGNSLEIVGIGNSAKVVAEDVSDTCDVAVHIVDTVLLPFEGEIVAESPSPAALVEASPSLTPTDLQEVDLQDCDTLSTVLSSRPELSLLSTTAITAGLDQVLNDPTQEITFFAPVDTAFQGLTALLGESTEQIITNLEYLNAVLAYHALDGVFTSQALVPGQAYPTLVQDRQGMALSITIGENGQTVIGEGSSATILESNIPACKSVVHLVDVVLLPVAQS